MSDVKIKVVFGTMESDQDTNEMKYRKTKVLFIVK